MPGVASLALGAGDRLLVLAAHPDDETLATGGLLQRAAQVGVQVRVVLVTDGENNPWAQRASERRFRVGAADRARFGARRRAEALAALDRLGVPRDVVAFLALPDQGVTGALVPSPAAALRTLSTHLIDWRPTIVAAPTAADLHPDHSALAVLARLLLRGAPRPGPPRQLAYLVHNPALRSAATAAVRLDLTPEETRRKQAAISCHASQLHLRGPWMRSFGSGHETFLDVPWPAGAPHPVASPRWNDDQLVIGIRTRPRLRSLGARMLLLVAEDETGAVAALSVPMPALPGRVAISDTSSGEAAGEASFAVGPLGGGVRLAAEVLGRARRVFVKLERRFGFFDEAGWLEIPRPPV